MSRRRRNAFLARPEGKHHGPSERPVTGARKWAGFHTTDSMDVAFPYAQVKAVDWFETVSVEDCPACGDAGCPECVGRYRLRDYPVVVALDMSGLKRLPDYDAVVLAKDSLQTVAQEIL